MKPEDRNLQLTIKARNFLWLGGIEDIVFVNRHEHKYKLAKNIHLKENLHIVNAFLSMTYIIMSLHSHNRS